LMGIEASACASISALLRVVLNFGLGSSDEKVK